MEDHHIVWCKCVGRSISCIEQLSESQILDAKHGRVDVDGQFVEHDLPAGSFQQKPTAGISTQRTAGKGVSRRIRRRTQQEMDREITVAAARSRAVVPMPCGIKTGCAA
jgi:hypothetical protein